MGEKIRYGYGEEHVYKGYGIMILTTKLTKEQRKSLYDDENSLEDGYIREFVIYPIDDDSKDGEWAFIRITAKNKEKIENGIFQFHSNISKKEIQPFILPLFDLKNPTKEEQSKALEDFRISYEKGKKNLLQKHKIYKEKSYEKTLRILQNTDAWYPGKFLVMFK